MQNRLVGYLVEWGSHWNTLKSDITATVDEDHHGVVMTPEGIRLQGSYRHLTNRTHEVQQFAVFRNCKTALEIL